jgi:hypothetical protein
MAILSTIPIQEEPARSGTQASPRIAVKVRRVDPRKEVLCFFIFGFLTLPCLMAQIAYSPATDNNLFVWFKADALALTNGSPVAAWSPSGGTMNQAVVQTSPTNQPQFVTNQQNGLPAVLFDGKSSYLTNVVGWFTPGQSHPLTIFTVYKYLGTAGFGNAFVGSVPGQVSWSLGESSGFITVYSQGMSGTLGNLYPIEPVFDAAWHILMVVFKGSNSYFRVDGGTNTPIGGTMGSAGITSLELGGHTAGNSLANCLLGELIFDNGDQSSREAAIFTYLSSRWAISLAPPVGSPPFILHWSDRRPIGMDVLGASVWSNPNNPRGWFGTNGPDYTSPGGMVTFSNTLMARARNEISVLKSMNAQGVIIWDVEGEEFPYLTYVGDPGKVPLLAPEMDAAADAFFAAYRAAGLRVGVTLRPHTFDAGPSLPAGTNGQTFVLTSASFGQRCYYYTNGWVQENVGAQVIGQSYWPELLEKVQYANTRWGCTLFYIDSYGVLDNWGQYSASVLTNILQAYPNVLLSPEAGFDALMATNMYAMSAPYLEPQYTGYFVPTNVPPLYPNAAGLIRINPPYTNVTSLTASVQAGNILLVDGWYASPSSACVSNAYFNAYIGRTLVPPDLHIVTNSP